MKTKKSFIYRAAAYLLISCASSRLSNAQSEASVVEELKVAENAIFRHIKFQQIETYQNLDDISFFMPRPKLPTLRQRPAGSN